MALQPDDTVCFCFHVTLRKIETFCLREQPKVPSQISECLSAGTGCGWCVPLIKHIHRRCCPQANPYRYGSEKETESLEAELTAEQHAAGRQEHLQAKKGSAKGTAE